MLSDLVANTFTCCMYTLLSNQPKPQNVHCNESKCSSRPLAYHRHWILTETPFLNPHWILTGSSLKLERTVAILPQEQSKELFWSYPLLTLKPCLNVGCCFSPTVPSISFFFFLFGFSIFLPFLRIRGARVRFHTE